MISISQGLFGAQAPALKPVKALKHDRGCEKKKMGVFEFFGRLPTKIHRKPTLFRKVSYKKPKNGVLVTTELGGGYQSSIGICRGPLPGVEFKAHDSLSATQKFSSPNIYIIIIIIIEISTTGSDTKYYMD